MWEETRQAATFPARKSSRPPVVPTKETDLDKPGDDDPFATPFLDEDGLDDYDDIADNSPYDNVIDSSPVDAGGSFNKPFFIPDDDGLEDDPDDSPELLARHVGIGGQGPLAADRLALLARMSSPAEINLDTGATAPDTGKVPGILPPLFFGDLRAGDGAFTAETMELCHERGVQAFSLRFAGGEGGVEAGKGAAAAADFEYEDVSGDYCCLSPCGRMYRSSSGEKRTWLRVSFCTNSHDYALQSCPACRTCSRSAMSSKTRVLSAHA